MKAFVAAATLFLSCTVAAQTVRDPAEANCRENPVHLLILGTYHMAIAMDQFLVRTSDNRGGPPLPTDAPADPDEIVVTAKTKEKQPRNLLTLGMDRLSACNSITYRKASQSLALRCQG